MTFNQYLQSKDACEPAVKWAGSKTIEEVVATCHRGDWLLWLAKKCHIGLQPLTLAKGHCANTVRHLMEDERGIKAVDVAIAFGEGKATREELADAAADFDEQVNDAFGVHAADADAYAANFLQTADICRKHIGDLIIEKVNQILTQTP